MSGQKILMASVLKPADDPRAYARMGKTLAAQQDTEIHIAGRPAASSPQEKNMHFHTLFNKGRLHLTRLFVGWKLWFLLLKVKPQKVIVNTPELLIVTIINQIFFGYKIYYDVQENYYSNIVHNQYYPGIIKYPLAWLIRGIERLSYPFVKYYLLAEKCYVNELSFTRKKATVIENKYASVHFEKIKKPQEETWLVYTGTIAKHYGILEAIALVKRLHQMDQSIRLKIVGYCQQKDLLKKITAEVAQHDFIELIGGNTFVPHSTILAHIEAADLGLLSYPYNKSTVNRIPTKLYEHLALKTPMLIQHNEYWKQLLNGSNSAIFIDYAQVDGTELLQKIKELIPESEDQELAPFWDTEAEKLTALLLKPLP